MRGFDRGVECEKKSSLLRFYRIFERGVGEVGFGRGEYYELDVCICVLNREFVDLRDDGVGDDDGKQQGAKMAACFAAADVSLVVSAVSLDRGYFSNFIPVKARLFDAYVELIQM